MSETVYIKTDKNIEVSKRMVLIGDVADVYCNDKKLENDIKHICLIILDEVGVNKNPFYRLFFVPLFSCQELW